MSDSINRNKSKAETAAELARIKSPGPDPFHTKIIPADQIKSNLGQSGLAKSDQPIYGAAKSDLTQTDASPNNQTQFEASKTNPVKTKATSSNTKKARKRLPLWARIILSTLRILLVPILCVAALYVGLVVGYSHIGEQDAADVLKVSTWKHLYNLVFAE